MTDMDKALIDKFNHLRTLAGLEDDKKLAHVMDVAERTVRDWNCGNRKPNPTVMRALEWISKGFRPPEMK
jgi:DNA-binding transcriptional regulator YiaG